MMFVEWMALYALLGACVGFMAGLLGVGGGGMLVPVLAMLFSHQGFDTGHVMHLALGTSFACMIVSSAASIRAHRARGNVVWAIFYGMAPGIITGTFLVSLVSTHVNSTYIALFFTFFMALIAVQMFLQWTPKTSNNPVKPSELFFAGTGIGSVSALAAVGGGFLVVVYLTYKGLVMKKAIGTSAAIGFPIAIAGTIGYLISGWSGMSGDQHTLGFIYVPAFLGISMASMLTVPFGVRSAQRLPDIYLKRIFACVCLALSIKMLFSITGT